jgi:hypothetical protein
MSQELIEVEITKEMMDVARKEAEQLGELKNSITRGEGNLAGLVGEMVAEQITGAKRKNTRDYDLVYEDGQTADVKTKRCRSMPEPHFECSIAGYNTTQKCDKYIFVRVQNDYSRAWVMGELTKEDYFKKATFIQQGQFDPRNRWRCTADCYNVPVSDLEAVRKEKWLTEPVEKVEDTPTA